MRVSSRKLLYVPYQHIQIMKYVEGYLGLPLKSGTFVFRGTQRQNFSKILEISFSVFLNYFTVFLEAYLCKLIEINLFGVFGGNFRLQKILEHRILSAEFRAADGCPKMLADLILHSKRHICLSETNRN